MAKQVETIEVKSVKGQVEETLTAEQKLIQVSDSVGKIVTLVSHDLVNNLVEVINKGERVFYGTYLEFKKGFKTSKLATSLLLAGIMIKFTAVAVEGLLSMVGLDVDLSVAHNLGNTAINAGVGLFLGEAGIKTFKGGRLGLSDDKGLTNKISKIKAETKPWDTPVNKVVKDFFGEESAEEALI